MGPGASASERSDISNELADPYCSTDEELAALLRGAPWRRFAAVGDSIVQGVSEPVAGYADRPWVERLAAALRRNAPELACTNLARRGHTAAKVRASQLEPALAFEPDLVCLFCGGNDLLRQDFDPADVEADIDAMTVAFTSRGALVANFTMQDIWRAIPEMPVEPLRPRQLELNDAVRRVSARHGTVLVEQRGLPPVADRNMYASDLMHASARGHAVIATLVARRLAERISAAPSV